MSKLEKKLLIILLIIACLLSSGYLIMHWLEIRSYRRMSALRKDPFRFHHRMASMLKKDSKENPFLSRLNHERKEQAIEILSNDKVDDTVIFLMNYVAHHNIYGYMSIISFVDEGENVWEIVYQPLEKDVNGLNLHLSFMSNEEVQGEVFGPFGSRMILRPDRNINAPKVEDVNYLEPPYLFLPTQEYENIIAGKGKLILLDKNGEALDAIPIKMVDFKW